MSRYRIKAIHITAGAYLFVRRQNQEINSGICRKTPSEADATASGAMHNTQIQYTIFTAESQGLFTIFQHFLFLYALRCESLVFYSEKPTGENGIWIEQRAKTLLCCIGSGHCPPVLRCNASAGSAPGTARARSVFLRVSFIILGNGGDNPSGEGESANYVCLSPFPP